MDIKTKDQNYQTFLENLHGKLNTPDDILEKVVKSAIGYEVEKKQKVMEGEINEVYVVTPTKGNDIIVRISREKHNRFEAEKWAMDRCRNAGVPVPQILLLSEVETDEEKLHICVESKIEGVSLEKLIKQNVLNQSEIKDIVINAGEILSKIHSIKTKGFGEINSTGVGKFESWSEYMLKQNKNSDVVLEQVKKIGVNPKLIHEAFEILEKNQDIYKNVDSRLVHSDYGIKHMLIHDDKINGIIDFENCRGADIAYDFSWWQYFGKNRPPVEWLMEGYKRNGNLGENFEARMHLVKIEIALSLLIYYGDAGHGFAKDITTKNLIEDIAFLK
ncbi:MAG: aminoglycoside phosphotransferase family protein [Patescibacteria group bacterium]